MKPTPSHFLYGQTVYINATDSSLIQAGKFVAAGIDQDSCEEYCVWRWEATGGFEVSKLSEVFGTLLEAQRHRDEVAA